MILRLKPIVFLDGVDYLDKVIQLYAGLNSLYEKKKNENASELQIRGSNKDNSEIIRALPDKVYRGPLVITLSVHLT